MLTINKNGIGKKTNSDKVLTKIGLEAPPENQDWPQSCFMLWAVSRCVQSLGYVFLSVDRYQAVDHVVDADEGINGIESLF